MEHIDVPRLSDCRELANTGCRVRRVAPQELVGLIDGSASPLVLVAVVRPARGMPREVQVEVRREPSRPGRPTKNEVRYVSDLTLCLCRRLAVAQKLAQCPRRVPVRKPLACR